MIRIELPASKSQGARYLVATYFAGTLPADPYFEDNDDLLVLQEALLEIYSDEEPIDYGDSPIDVHASGTALRFVMAVCASSEGADYVIAGTPRLMQRPIWPLIKVLREAGAVITELGPEKTGPYRVKGGNLEGGEMEIEGNISSQFISALMLVSPVWSKGLKLNFTTPLVSRPYLEMTAKVMRQFGINVDLTEEYVEVKKGNYQEPPNLRVEADWSSASFFYEACALGAGEILLENLKSPVESMQGDSFCADMFEKIGVKSVFSQEGTVISEIIRVSEKVEGEDRIEIDFKDTPDLVLPIALACMLCNRKFRFIGVRNLRLKESDRLLSLENESRKLGFILKADDDSLEWEGEKDDKEENPVIETYSDHRVAMSFAMVALKTGEIRIKDPDVVDKSFSLFWEQLGNLPLEYSRDGEVMTVKRKNIN